jgi:hypothetical protein
MLRRREMGIPFSLRGRRPLVDEPEVASAYDGGKSLFEDMDGCFEENALAWC